MMTTFINLLLDALALYLSLGALFSIYFYFKGGVQIDAGMKGAPWHFKLILLPGVVLFWVVLLKKILKKT